MKKILLLLISVLSCFTLISCNKEDDGDKTLPTENVEVGYEIHTELQKNYLLDTYDMYWKYAKGAKELSKPLPITITWDLPVNYEYDFYLSEDEQMTNARIISTKKNEISIYNLKINTPYYWYVSYEENQFVINSNVETFTIETKTPRNLNIDGVTNARDLGGYTTLDGKVTNQGLIYRTAKFNDDESTTILITEDGIKEMVEVLKVKTELDIRKTEDNENGGITESPLGPTVNYISVPMKSSGDKIKLNLDIFKDVFAVFGEKENYPIVVHCSIGTDRTGLICFFINALLGVSEDDLYRDYLFSNFGEIGSRRMPDEIDGYLSVINGANGSTLAEKTYNYLVSIGVESSDLDTIKEMMLN